MHKNDGRKRKDKINLLPKELETQMHLPNGRLKGLVNARKSYLL